MRILIATRLGAVLALSCSVVAGAGCAGPPCGDGRYANVSLTLVDFASSLPVGGARLALDACPDADVETNLFGSASLQMARELAYNPRVTKDGYITVRTGEQKLAADFQAGGPMFSTSLASGFPHLDDASPAILALLFPTVAEDDDDPCTQRSGATFSVVGHPDAVVTYYAGEGVDAVLDETLTATGTSGSAEIAGVPATTGDALVELAVEKPGCEASFVSYPHTGRYILEDGVLTLAAAFMPPL